MPILVVPTLRRGFLKQLTLGLTAFPLAACFPRSNGSGGTIASDGGAGGTDDAAAPPPLDEAEANLLSAEFLMEDYAIFAYKGGASVLEGPDRELAKMFGDHHKAHQDYAGETLIARGLAEPTPPATYDLTPPETAEEVIRLSLTLESQAVSGYHAFVSQHGEPALRTVAASILACEVAHVVAWLQVLGDDEAFDFAFGTDLPPHVKAFLGAKRRP